MTGAEFLNYLVGTTNQIGLLDKNADDTEFRRFILQCLNLALGEMSTKQSVWHWKDLEVSSTTTTRINEIDLDVPEDLDGDKVFGLWDTTNNVTYDYIEHDKFLRLVPNPAQNIGSPYWYTIWGRIILLYPVPSSSFLVFLRYIRTIGSLSDNTATSGFPNKYDYVVIAGALKYAYQFDPQLGDAHTQQAIFNDGIQSMILENSTNINSLGKVESHRNRMRGVRIPYPVAQ